MHYWACLLLIAFAMGCQMQHKIPVILDTDIGDDIDDSWALAMVLKSPQFDVKLITTTDGQQEYRNRLLHKMLWAAERTDIPIGIGAGNRTGQGRLAPWAAESRAGDFPSLGGVDEMIRVIHASPTPVTIIAIGPLQTIAEALKHDPSIASKAN